MVDFSEYRNKAGIYKWKNKINHNCYIGQAKDLNRRLIHHFSNVKTGRYNSPLYKAVAKLRPYTLRCGLSSPSLALRSLPFSVVTCGLYTSVFVGKI